MPPTQTMFCCTYSFFYLANFYSFHKVKFKCHCL
jgi:hypothetical protein